MDYHGRLAWIGGECQRCGCGAEWGIWVPLEPGHDLLKGGICCGYCGRLITKTEFREALARSAPGETVTINEKG